MARGASKPSRDLTLSNYSATLYTLAVIYDLGNQLLRRSAGVAEQMVRHEGAKAISLGEVYYVLSGTGSSEPKGIITSIAAASATLTTSHTASDSTVAGSVRAGVAKAVEALSTRNYQANAIVLNSGDFAHMFVAGADAAGFWVDETGGTRLLGLPVVTTTALTSKTALVGDFSTATLFVGQDYRVDVSQEAGSRWDLNETGFRFGEDLAFGQREHGDSANEQLALAPCEFAKTPRYWSVHQKGNGSDAAGRVSICPLALSLCLAIAAIHLHNEVIRRPPLTWIIGCEERAHLLLPVQHPVTTRHCVTESLLSVGERQVTLDDRCEPF